MKNALLALIVAGVSVIAHLPIAVLAQAPAAAPAAAPPRIKPFEVVSIRKSGPPDPANPLTIAPMIVPAANGSIRGQNLPLRLLVRVAYKLEDEQVSGGPDWQLSQKFDINAKAEDGEPDSVDAMRERVALLLTDRFKLKSHVESREMNVSALVIADKDGKLGPNLRKSTAECGDQLAESRKMAEELRKNPANAMAAMAQMKCGIIPQPQPGPNGQMTLMIKGMGQPMENLVSTVNQLLGRSVVDKTGLTGLYDFEMEMPLDPEMLRRAAAQLGVNAAPGAGANAPQYDGPALGTILQERLGLKLDSQKAPVKVLVIDSAEMPETD
jgi:uncharacterized protein (TIGR03435 family)